MKKEKVVFLTYDDGPNEQFVEKVDYLNSKGIKAVWFSQGCRLEADLDAAVYAIKTGHIIANHSYDHPHFSELTLEQAKSQILRTEALIEKAYTLANMNQPFKCFRFPYLDLGAGSDCFPPDMKESKTVMFQTMLKELGFVCPVFEGLTYEWYYHIGFGDTVSVESSLDIDDWRISDESEDIEAAYENVLNKLDEVNPERGHGLNTPGSSELVVFHEFVEFKYFKGIVDKLIDKGITFALPTRPN